MKHFCTAAAPKGSDAAWRGFLSARVGSSGDNALGGWKTLPGIEGGAESACLNRIRLTRQGQHCVSLSGTVAGALKPTVCRNGPECAASQRATPRLLAVLTGRSGH
jgi:hypothetical protein